MKPVLIDSKTPSSFMTLHAVAKNNEMIRKQFINLLNHVSEKGIRWYYEEEIALKRGTILFYSSSILIIYLQMHIEKYGIINVTSYGFIFYG